MFVIVCGGMCVVVMVPHRKEKVAVSKTSSSSTEEMKTVPIILRGIGYIGLYLSYV